MPSLLDLKVKKVTKKFLLDLADSIYSTETRQFLRLCNGTLQNGPDPTDKERIMHCGLGELFFAMTGRQPETYGIDEEGVTQMALENSPLYNQAEKAVAKAKSDIKKMNLPDDVQTELLNVVEDSKEAFSTKGETFKSILDEIPDENDDGIDTAQCTVVNWRDRSRRVATQLRKAAKLLP